MDKIEGSETSWEEIIAVRNDTNFPHASKFYKMAMAEAKAAILEIRAKDARDG